MLTEPGTMLRDGERQLSSRGESIFRVERLEREFADIATDDGTVRGWVDVDRILPLDKAMDYFNGKIAKDPKDAQAYKARGQIWIEKEQWDRALADLDSALRARSGRPERPPSKIPAWRSRVRDRGLAWDAKRFFDRAFADLTEAIRLDPGNVALVLSRGKVCSKRGRFTQAMADIDWFIRMRPSDPAGYSARGEALMENLESEAAIAEFTRAIEVDPTYVSALLLRAKTWRRRGDFARAIDDYAEATRRAPDDPEAHRALPGSSPPAPPRIPRRPPGRPGGNSRLRADPLEQHRLPEALAAACAEAGDFPSAAKWQARVHQAPAQT